LDKRLTLERKNVKDIIKYSGKRLSCLLVGYHVIITSSDSIFIDSNQSENIIIDLFRIAGVIQREGTGIRTDVVVMEVENVTVPGDGVII
jgi:hypothetical protein